MSQKKERLRRFFAEHPICCFCGGNTPAITEDHVPNRAVFDNRIWPEGYNFPACKNCNEVTRPDEKILAYLTRINHGRRNLTETEQREIAKTMRGVSTEFPEAFSSMRMRRNEVRQWLRERGAKKAEGQSLSEIPIVSIGNTRFRTAIKNFSVKLLCALHYKHTKEIVPQAAAICGRWYSNIQVLDGEIPREFLDVIGNGVVLKRSNNLLHEQFNYNYVIAADKDASAYICEFRRSFALVGLVSLEWDLPSDFDENLEQGVFKSNPFRHP
jgi:hypothetical protein